MSDITPFWTALREQLEAGVNGGNLALFLIGELTLDPPSEIDRDINDPARRFMLQRAVRLTDIFHWDMSRVATEKHLITEFRRRLPVLWENMQIKGNFAGSGALIDRRLFASARLKGAGSLAMIWGMKKLIRATFHGDGIVSIVLPASKKAAYASLSGTGSLNLSYRNKMTITGRLVGQGFVFARTS